MNIPWLRMVAVSAVACCLSSWASAEDSHQNRFATIQLDGKKIGHVHYIVKHNELGELEELKTRVSVSILGIKLYGFTQDLHEQWSGSELQSLRGNTNDDGKIHVTTLKRTPTNYEANLNDKPLTLPHDAFPISLWHYAITTKSLLFDLTDLSLMQVEVSGHEDTVVRDGETIETERFDFTGDWEGRVWFDQNKEFVKAEYVTNDRRVTIVMDP